MTVTEFGFLSFTACATHARARFELRNENYYLGSHVNLVTINYTTSLRWCKGCKTFLESRVLHRPSRKDHAHQIELRFSCLFCWQEPSYYPLSTLKRHTIIVLSTNFFFRDKNHSHSHHLHRRLKWA